MSRNPAGPSRPLGNAPKAKPAPAPPGGGPPSSVPRRSAGAVPGEYLLPPGSHQSADSQVSPEPHLRSDKPLPAQPQPPSNPFPLTCATFRRRAFPPRSAKARLLAVSSSHYPSERQKRPSDTCFCLKTLNWRRCRTRPVEVALSSFLRRGRTITPTPAPVRPAITGTSARMRRT